MLWEEPPSGDSHSAFAKDKQNQIELAESQ